MSGGHDMRGIQKFMHASQKYGPDARLLVTVAYWRKAYELAAEFSEKYADQVQTKNSNLHMRLKTGATIRFHKVDSGLEASGLKHHHYTHWVMQDQPPWDATVQVLGLLRSKEVPITEDNIVHPTGVTFDRRFMEKHYVNGKADRAKAETRA